MRTFTPDQLKLIEGLSEGLPADQLQEFQKLIHAEQYTPGDPEAYIRTCHDAVTGQGADFIEDGGNPTGDVDFVDA